MSENQDRKKLTSPGEAMWDKCNNTEYFSEQMSNDEGSQNKTNKMVLYNSSTITPFITHNIYIGISSSLCYS